MTNQQIQNSKRNSKYNKRTSEEKISFNYTLQHKDIDLRWEDEMEIKEDNLLTSYNLAEVMSNNMTVEAIQEGSNHPDFKAVFKKYKNIQFKNMKELG